jgi:hypothetical protein
MNSNTLREARLYLPLKEGLAIVAPIYCNMESLNYEQESPIVVRDWRVPEALASAFRKAIERFERKDRDLRGDKPTDWPAYNASRCRSVRDFKATYQAIFIQAANAEELYYEARTRPAGVEEIELCVGLPRHASDTEIGRKLLHVYEACRQWPTNLP